MELHAGLDIILDRAPGTVREKVARDITRGAGRFGNFPVSNPAGHPPTARENRLMRLLARTIDSGNAETIEAVTKTLEVFARYVETKDPKSSAAAPGPRSSNRPGRGRPRRRPNVDCDPETLGR
jgi:hypothetical protein